MILSEREAARQSEPFTSIGARGGPRTYQSAPRASTLDVGQEQGDRPGAAPLARNGLSGLRDGRGGGVAAARWPSPARTRNHHRGADPAAQIAEAGDADGRGTVIVEEVC